MGTGIRDVEAWTTQIDEMQRQIEVLRSELAKRSDKQDTFTKVTLVLSAAQLLVALAQLLV